MNDETRERLLDEVAAGLRERDDRARREKRLGRGYDGPSYDAAEVWRLEVALLDARGELVAVAPIGLSLSWIVDRSVQSQDTTDLTPAAHAHVQYFEGPCFSCEGEWHRAHEVEPEEDEDDDGSAGPAYLDDQDGPAPELGSE